MNSARTEVNNLDKKLSKVLCDALKTDSIIYEASIDTVDVWDSMAHMEIMVAIEKNYSVRIEPREIIKLTSVKAIQKYLNSKGVL